MLELRLIRKFDTHKLGVSSWLEKCKRTLFRPALVLHNETGCGCDGVAVEDCLKACIRYVIDIVKLFENQFFT
jgi:hypothetical protein